jgi:hypothetical protein
MLRQHSHPSHPNLSGDARGLRRWDRQLVWLAGIGFCSLTWTALAVLALRVI